MKVESVGAATAETYNSYYELHGRDRNNPLKNQGAVMQMVANDLALVRTLAAIGYDPAKHLVLDVGGGSGGSLIPFLQVGAASNKLFCVDVLEDRIAEGKRRFPGIDFQCLDASKLPFRSEEFDIVFSSMIFTQMTDDQLARRVIAEMHRVTKANGHILLRDWTFPRNNATYRSMSSGRRKSLFDPARFIEIHVEQGAIVPPIGRRISSFVPSLYFPFQRFFPLLTGLKVFAYRKFGH